MDDSVMIGYARSRDPHALAQQVELLVQAGLKLDDIYRELSGRANTPELQKALRATREGDVFVVAKLIYLAHSKNQLVRVFRWLKDERVHFWSIDDVIDTRTTFGANALPVLLEVIRNRRQEMRELTLAGLAKARAAGRSGGRPIALSDQKKAEALRLLALNQFSMADVAKQLGVARGTLYNAGLARSLRAIPKIDRPSSRGEEKKKTTRRGGLR